jgi:hypothetical protein
MKLAAAAVEEELAVVDTRKADLVRRLLVMLLFLPPIYTHLLALISVIFIAHA